MHRIIIDGNAFYEIDEECVRQKQERAAEKQRKMKEEELGKMDMGNQTMQQKATVRDDKKFVDKCYKRTQEKQTDQTGKRKTR